MFAGDDFKISAKASSTLGKPADSVRSDTALGSIAACQDSYVDNRKLPLGVFDARDLCLPGIIGRKISVGPLAVLRRRFKERTSRNTLSRFETTGPFFSRISVPTSYFPAQNCVFLVTWLMARAKQIPPEAVRQDAAMRVEGRLRFCAEWTDGRWLRRGLLFQGPAYVDEVVGDDAEPDPALHSGVAFVAAAVEAVSALGDADASLASGAPFLALAKPALLLLALARGALGGAIGNAHALDALGFGRPLVVSGIECGVRRHEARNASEPRLVDVDGADQKVAIAGPPVIDFIGGDDLVFGFLQFHRFAELGRLAGLAFADDFR